MSPMCLASREQLAHPTELAPAVGSLMSVVQPEPSVKRLVVADQNSAHRFWRPPRNSRGQEDEDEEWRPIHVTGSSGRLGLAEGLSGVLLGALALIPAPPCQ